MPIDPATSNEHDDEEHRIIKYIVEKLESYAHKSRLWKLIHASHIRRNLLRKSRRVSKIHSMSEDLVRQCISNVLNDVDQYIDRIQRLVTSSDFIDLTSTFRRTSNNNSAWHSIQLQRARQLFSTQDDQELLDQYYAYVKDTLTPRLALSDTEPRDKETQVSFDLNLAYEQAENEGKVCWENLRARLLKWPRPDVQLIKEMVHLGQSRHVDSNRLIPLFVLRRNQ